MKNAREEIYNEESFTWNESSVLVNIYIICCYVM